MLFRKKKSLFSEVDDSKQIVYDFRRRNHKLFENYRALSYKKPSLYDLQKMKKENADILARFIAGHAVDSGNEDCLVDKILGPVREGMIFLDDQSLEHLDFYTRQGSRAVADGKDIEKILEFWRAKEETMVKEHEYTELLWNRCCGYNKKEVEL